MFKRSKFGNLPPNTELSVRLSRPFTSQINWIFQIARRHKNLWKSAKWLVVVGIPPGLKLERKCWSLKSCFRGTLKEASEKNNALRRLKHRFEGSIN
ncbi:hypothetical protein AVEN_239851-1 [Araneus ventricosus]|uniref:Uncharacterized protein n=1 Tax=Araneus ventricosus TaxID=182803 RepID=A0A4Y2H2H2_ARAVE|nr:hypothetical protein AVEN_239851-1 [Araneus ventricosus]